MRQKITITIDKAVEADSAQSQESKSDACANEFYMARCLKTHFSAY